ncbi:polysaccharide lyase family 1 protein [Uliginosibacterium paludis]|uniref:Polysaccharide lyase family 1 protein n=1 Tax=Uliginosibacterium paludis TaxID=1615952 RepID=A0ABV2CSI5_9RHOO
MHFRSKPLFSALALASFLATGAAQAGPIGYAAGTTGGGSATPVTVSTLAQAQAAVDAYSGSGGLVLKYTGSFDFSTITDACAQHGKAAQILEIKNKGNISIIGADGSSANFGIRVVGASSNIIIQNMSIALTPGGSDSDIVSIEGNSTGAPGYVWVDHNTFYTSMVECGGAGDTEFDGMIDSKKGAHHITLSYNYLHDHHKMSLNGYTDSDTSSRYITWHHNWIENVGSRAPLQRGGLSHLYNNYFNKLVTSGANLRMGAVSLIEANYFENSQNPVTSRDSSALGYWDLRNNNITSPNDFGTYGITWVASDSSPSKDATDWTTTRSYPEALGYSYKACAAASVKTVVKSLAGAGKGLRTDDDCSLSGSSSSASSSTASAASSASSSKSSSAASSTASSSAASSSAASSSAASSSTGAPTLSGSGDYPDGFGKCAALGETCSVSAGTGWVAFGRKGHWVSKYVGVGKSIACTVAAFGSDPAGNPNKCAYQK